MCGILGLFNLDGQPVERRKAQMALDRIRHRGPDDEGYLLIDSQAKIARLCAGRDTDPRLELPSLSDVPDGNYDLIFGHRRLSILDVSPAGHQPMSSADGRYWITYNGEVYNYIELREELARKGHTFATGTDTEVILAAYKEWGAGMLARFVGMFAFALYDVEARKMLFARDFFGIKPFYYAFTPNGSAFGSEIKALLELPWISRRINPRRMYDYLRFGITDHGDETMYADIRQLPAAHYMEIDLRNPESARPVRYWDPAVRDRLDLSFEEASRHLQELFLENIRLHLRSDVAVGSCLSGGIDSSSIVMAMRQLEGSDLALHTFSFVSDDPLVGEERFADLVAAAANAQEHKVRPVESEFVRELDDLIALQDEPFGSTSIYAQHRVFRLVGESGIKVMLDGQGADEMFGGYGSLMGTRLAAMMRNFQWARASRFSREVTKHAGAYRKRLVLGAFGRLVPPSLRQMFLRTVNEPLMLGWMNRGWFENNGVRGHWRDQATGRDMFRDELKQWVQSTTLPSLLRYEDRNSMHYSIESRVPFLTSQLLDFVFALPDEYLMADDGLSKAVFRNAMRGICPDAVLDRRDKIGFATPEREWLRAMRPWVEETLQSARADQLPFLNLDMVKQEVMDALDATGYYSVKTWRCLNVIKWVENW